MIARQLLGLASYLRTPRRLSWQQSLRDVPRVSGSSYAVGVKGSGLGSLLGFVAMACAITWASAASALPAFAQQTGQPCSQCHVGAFGPQLKPYGRDFKVFGYVNGDGKNHVPPIAIIGIASLTKTQSPQTSPPAPHFSDNNNVALDELSILYGGKVAAGAGAFVELTYDGVARGFTIDNLDVKRAFDLGSGERDLLVGLDLNNRPTVQDLWNSTPTWGFPYNASSLAPTPTNATLLDGALAQRVLGLGVYGLWNDLIYAEATAYAPVNNQTLNRLGVASPAGTDSYDGIIPYWRLAAQHDFGGHYFEAGAYGIAARRFPGGDQSAGVDRIQDAALDATYQYTASAKHFVSAHATWIHETDTLDASRVLSGSRPRDDLDTIRADISYSYDNTWTPSFQVFKTSGSADPLFFGGATGRPDSQGYIVELAFVPFGKSAPTSFISNARITLQWVGYTRFDGVGRGASDNNTLYLSTRFAFAPFSGFVHR